MPNTDIPITYTATAGNNSGTPTSPVTWGGWTVTGTPTPIEGTHYTKTGGGTTNQIVITWLIEGRYKVNVTADNCGPAVPGSVSVNVTNG